MEEKNVNEKSSLLKNMNNMINSGKRAYSGYEYMMNTPSRILSHFLKTMAKIMMKNFIKSILVTLFLIINTIGLVFYFDSWMAKFFLPLFFFIICLIIFLIINHKLIFSAVLNAFKATVDAEVRQVVRFIHSPEYDHTIQDLHLVDSLFNIESIEKQSIDLCNQTSQKITKTKLFKKLINTPTINTFLNEQAEKIKIALTKIQTEIHEKELNL